MRRPLISTGVVLAAVLLAATGCGGSGRAVIEGRAMVAPTRVPRTTVPRSQLWSPKPHPPTTPPTTAVPLPNPVDIPDDPYAPEPVVQIGTVEIPKIGLTHPLFDGVTLRNIDEGPSHWPGTALPGQIGNVVVAGHRTVRDHPFKRIAELVPGDQVIFTVNGSRSTYSVTSSQIVNPSDTWIANQTPAYTATLYACHPPGSQTQRYVVHLQLAT